MDSNINISQRHLLFLFAWLVIAGSACAQKNAYCGTGVTPTDDPTDLAHVAGDQSLQFFVDQPANINSCSKGIILLKCGDYLHANQVFDKCIDAGYVGAMIRKSMMIEEGLGVAPDPAKAAALMHRAATSSDTAYNKHAKRYYAAMLYEGRGVEKNEAEALKWFREAANAGSQEAREFLIEHHQSISDETNSQQPTAPIEVDNSPPGTTEIVPLQVQPKLASHPANHAKHHPSKQPTLSNKPTDFKETQTTESAEMLEIRGQKLTQRTARKNIAPLPITPTTPASLLTLCLLLLIGLGSAHRQRSSTYRFRATNLPHST